MNVEVLPRWPLEWKPDHVRVLCATTANDGHFGPLLPFAEACVTSGHEVRVAAPLSYGPALARAGFRHEPCADAPPGVIGPIMAGLASLTFAEANDVVVREVFGRIDAQAALPRLLEVVEGWRPDVVLRESAELASLAAAERFGVPHVQVCVGMHEVAARFAKALGEPLAELGRQAGLSPRHLASALAAEATVSLVPELLDFPAGDPSPDVNAFKRFHPPERSVFGPRPADWGDPDQPLVYVTFGSVAGSLPSFAGVFREALDALDSLDAYVVMTAGRRIDLEALTPVPPNVQVHPWLPQEAVLAHAAAMLGHGGFGTTMGALALGVPQVVAPLFAFDQVVNGEHVAAVGAGLTVEASPGAVSRAVGEISRLLQTPSYATNAQIVAAAIRRLPPPTAAVPMLSQLAR